MTKEEIDSGTFILSIGGNTFYENGIYSVFTYFGRHIFQPEFKPYSEIEYICRIHYTGWPDQVANGIHMETKDKKILNLFDRKTEIKNEDTVEILNILREKIGPEWRDIYDEEYVITNGYYVFKLISEDKEELLKK